MRRRVVNDESTCHPRTSRVSGIGMMDDTTPQSPPPDTEGEFSYSVAGRVESARGFYYWLAAIAGAFGGLVLIQPASIGAMLPGATLSRWWGLLGLVAGGGLYVAGHRLTQMEMPDDFDEQRREAVEADNWPKVYEWMRLKADVCRQQNDDEGESEARERMIEIALERLDNGQFQALSQLRRLEELVDDPTDVIERIEEILRDLEAHGSLVEVLERRLARLDDEGDDEQRSIRIELLELYRALDHWDDETCLGPMRHLEWLLDHDGSEAVVEQCLSYARESGAHDAIAERLEAAGCDEAATRLLDDE